MRPPLTVQPLRSQGRIVTPEQRLGPPVLTVEGLATETTAIPGSMDPRGAAATQLGPNFFQSVPELSNA